MNNIAVIDPNFLVATHAATDKVFYDILSAPFRIYGVQRTADGFVRMPCAVAERISPAIGSLAKHTAGGRVRFSTNSSTVTICATFGTDIGRMSHFTLCGAAGFDLYDRNIFVGTFIPPYDVIDRYVSTLTFPFTGQHEVTIYFPLYSSISTLLIGLDPGSSLAAAPSYQLSDPMVSYGSSITQGGCASRPGNCYQNILSRRFHVDQLNLGFSGNAHGELSMAHYIAELKQSVFIYDYDANAPTVDHLSATHEPFFLVIREAQPNLPVIMLSKPEAYPSETSRLRSAIVQRTWSNALARGDKNVYWIDISRALRTYCDNDGTVDNTHPNDLGFRCIADALSNVIEHLPGYLPKKTDIKAL